MCGENHTLAQPALGDAQAVRAVPVLGNQQMDGVRANVHGGRDVSTSGHGRISAPSLAAATTLPTPVRTR